MLKLKEGYHVPFPEKLSEGYEMEENSIVANVGVDKLEEVIQHFIAIKDEPIFFILELPASGEKESPKASGIVTALHKDIYYIDGCSVDAALILFERTKDLLLADGMCQFGFGCHESHDEIMVEKYNVVSIYSQDIQKYNDFYEPHNIKEAKNFITAWDTFSLEHPGSSERIEKNRKTVYDLPELLKGWGIYLAETVEE